MDGAMQGGGWGTTHRTLLCDQTSSSHHFHFWAGPGEGAGVWGYGRSKVT